MSKIGIMDLFCGTGGFSYGFSKYSNDFETVCAIDILEDATKTAKLNHPEAVIINEDIREIRPSEIENTLKKLNKKVDVIIGGPPCQGFSSIRPFRSDKEDDPRNNLFEQFALFVNYFKPKAFVLENVVGLATYKKGQTIKIIEECFKDLGYEVEWKILNAANYGVPQKRERLIMIGAKKGISIDFPEPTHYFSGKTIGHKNKDHVITTEYNLFNSIEYKPAVTTLEAISDLPIVKAGEMKEDYSSKPKNEYQKEMRGNSKVVSLHSSTKHSTKMLEIIKHSGPNISYIPKHLISSGFTTSYSRLESDEPANTITVNFVHPSSNKCIHPYQDRALTPREGARLQSFDDNFKFFGSRTKVVKQIGNAVPPLLGKAIAKQVHEAVKKELLSMS